MINRKASRIIVFLIALGLTAPLSAWAGSRGHYQSHGYGYHVYSGHRGHHGYYSHDGGRYGYYNYHGYSGPYGHRSRSGHYGQHYSPQPYAYPGHPRKRVGSGESRGALDLYVNPKTTEVYLNGQYIGVAGDFNGYPSYLWLQKGTHELMFYKEGYLTVIRELSIHPGAVIDVRQRMVPGESVPPGELTTNTSPSGN